MTGILNGGDWHDGPDWVNGTIPVIATPGNHEYRRIDQGSRSERFWLQMMAR